MVNASVVGFGISVGRTTAVGSGDSGVRTAVAVGVAFGSTVGVGSTVSGRVGSCWLQPAPTKTLITRKLATKTRHIRHLPLILERARRSIAALYAGLMRVAS